jgi:hypothetical protein
MLQRTRLCAAPAWVMVRRGFGPEMERAMARAAPIFAAAVCLALSAGAASSGEAGSTLPKTGDRDDGPTPAQGEARDTIFPDSSDRTLRDEEIAGLGCETLWIARNEIYARNLYCFKTARGRSYFGERCSSESADILSRLEQANVERIRARERRLGCN